MDLEDCDVMIPETKNQRSLRWKLILAFAAIYVVWGSTYLAIRYAVETIPPFLMMGGRSLVAGTILYSWGRSRGNPGPRPEHWRPILITGASFFLVGHGLLAWAQQKVPSGFAALLMASEPFWIMIIESATLKDSRIRIPGMIGLCLGFAGMAFLVTSTKDLGLAGSDLLGPAAILIGTLSWGGGAVYSRVADLPRSPPVAAGLQLIAGGTMLVIVSILLGEPQHLQVGAITNRSLLGFAYLVLMGSVVTFGAYIWLLTFTSATRVSTHTYVNPIIAVFIGWLVAGEPVSPSMITATVLIVTAVYLILKDQSPRSD